MSFTCKEPKLRFREFQGEWEEKQLGEVGEFRGGGTPSKNIDEYWHGTIPWISSSDIEEDNIHKINISRFINEKAIKESATKIIPKKSILFVSRVGVGKLAINKSELCTSQDFTNFIPKNSDSYYLGYFFIAKKNILIGFNQGTSIKGFTKNDLETLKVLFPSKPEQEKIASFLTVVDAKIEQLTCKEKLLEKYKKSAMQKLFSQELRFTCNDGSEFPEWEEKKLEETLDYVQPIKYLVESTEYDNSYKTPVLTAGKTFILGYTNETKGIFKDNLPVILFDDFTTATQFVNFPFKAKSSAMKILVPKKEINIKFIYEAMQTIKYELGGHERHWISKYSQLEILIPSLHEQTKIANFLSVLDEKLLHVKTQIEQTKQFKKALLQQMFV